MEISKEFILFLGLDEQEVEEMNSSRVGGATICEGGPEGLMG